MAQLSESGTAGVVRTADEGVDRLEAVTVANTNDVAPDAAAPAPAIDAVAEDQYWREHYIRRPYADDTLSYDHYRPAYRYGWESRARLDGQRWDQVERDLERGWREHRGTSRLGWGDAKQAARDAWQRVDRRIADARPAEVYDA
jgi:hypothetical protein